MRSTFQRKIVSLRKEARKMARQLEAFPERPSTARYPWDQWLDGHPWELIRGEDFQAKPGTFRTNAQTQAKKRGGRVRSRALDVNGREAVVIQFQRGS
jgi:hypothetical protein